AFNGIDISGIYNPATAPMFYDLRAKSLEEQSLKPIGSLEEMRGNIFSAETATDSVVNRLKNIPAYEVMFKNAFGENSINAQNIAKAIASFERTLITTNTPFDNFMRGDDDALSKKQKTGMTIFIDAGCNRCHNGPMLSDFKTHVLGVEDNSKLTASDDGENGTYAFRTPTLRNLKYTAPYMHSGTINTLEDVVKFYNKTGRRESQNPHVSSASLARELPGPIKPEDISSLIDFLNSLNAETFDKSAPATVPSGLKVGGNI
ncbi:MAG: cytochrome-c peroxidase, partial [Sphingobacteriales bacterium]